MDTTSQAGAMAAPAAEPATNLPFTFTGKAGEYFGIWIVNLLLSIVTVGIYTAWAKVRRLRYFYGNTWLDGHNFEYHARPRQILIGRIIVVVAIVVYQVLITLSPLFVAILIPYLLALPWLINKSMAFNARMTSYRNVRLNFRGTYWGALGVFVGMPLAAMFTLGLLAPIASRLSANYIGRHLGFGTARFETDAPIGRLYANFGMTVVFVILVSLVLGGVGAIIGGGMASFESFNSEFADDDLAKAMFGASLAGGIAGLYIAIILGFLFYGAGARNIAFNHSVLDGKHRFSSSVGRWRYIWILVSNLFAAVFTFGLLRPWAAVRSWRYLVSCTSVEAQGSLDGFIDAAAPEGSVGAAEFFDIEGVDFGL